MFHAVLAAVLAASPRPAGSAEVVKRLNDQITAGEYAKSLAEAEALAAEAERRGDVALQSRALILASDALYYLNRQPETKPVMEKALALSQGIGDDGGIGRAY